MAIGAAAAGCPAKTVALIGDGGLMVNLGELATAVDTGSEEFSYTDARPVVRDARLCEEFSPATVPSNRGGNMSRLFSGALLAGVLAVTWLTITPGTARAADANKCTIATKDDNPVVQACKDGGIKKAKATMKNMQKSAKEKGMKVECDDRTTTALASSAATNSPARTTSCVTTSTKADDTSDRESGR